MDYTELRNIALQIASLQMGCSSANYWNKKYYMFFDETNNTKKLLIKLSNDGSWQFNNNPNVNFVLGGIAMRTDENIKYEELCDALGLQKNSAKETKSTSIFYGGFANALKSRYFEPLMKLLLDKHWYIHFEELNLLYYSIVDIVDSLKIPTSIELFYPQIRNFLKDILYRSIRNCTNDIVNLFVEYNYPDVQSDKISSFILSLVSIIKRNNSIEMGVPTEQLSFLVDVLLQNINTEKMVFIQDESPLMLIKRYYDMYCDEIYMFKNANIVFDREEEVMEFISKNPVELEGTNLANYIFKDSKDEPRIQLSDYVVRLIALYMQFLEKDMQEIKNEIETFSERQSKNFSLFQDVLYMSLNENPLFYHSINCVSTICNRDYLLQEYRRSHT